MCVCVCVCCVCACMLIDHVGAIVVRLYIIELTPTQKA